jgi:hypothetical protein
VTVVVVKQGEEIWLDLILSTNKTLKLYKNDVESGLTAAQKKALTESSFTEATFTGYTSKSLTGGSWTTTQGDPTIGTYAQQTFTSSANQAAQSIYGYYVIRASDNKLEYYEQFSGPISISLLNDAINVTPTLQLDDDPSSTSWAAGVKASQVITSSSVGYTATGATDFSLASFAADSSRNYKICLNVDWVATVAAGEWYLYIQVAGADYAMIGDASADGTNINEGVVSGGVLWQPATGTYTVTIKLYEIVNGSTLTFYGDASTPRQFWIEDIGPRTV